MRLLRAQSTVPKGESGATQKHECYRAFQSRGIPIFGADGEIEEWVGALTDVQERSNYQQRLKEIEARSARQIAELEEIYDRAPIGLLRTQSGPPIYPHQSTPCRD